MQRHVGMTECGIFGKCSTVKGGQGAGCGHFIDEILNYLRQFIKPRVSLQSIGTHKVMYT